MHVGRYQLGQFVNLGVQCTTIADARIAATPDAAPLITVYDASGNAAIASRPLPRQGAASLGLFGFGELLGSGYAIGTYCARITYAVSGTLKAILQFFEVVAGGDARGAYTSLAWFDTPAVSYLIAGTESGVLESNSNPSL